MNNNQFEEASRIQAEIDEVKYALSRIERLDGIEKPDEVIFDLVMIGATMYDFMARVKNKSLTDKVRALMQAELKSELLMLEKKFKDI